MEYVKQVGADKLLTSVGLVIRHGAPSVNIAGRDQFRKRVTIDNEGPVDLFVSMGQIYPGAQAVARVIANTQRTFEVTCELWIVNNDAALDAVCRVTVETNNQS